MLNYINPKTREVLLSSEEFEEQVVKEMLDIVTNDEKYQEFVKEMIQNKEN